MLSYRRVTDKREQRVSVNKRGKYMSEIRKFRGNGTYPRVLKSTKTEEKENFKKKIRRHRLTIFYRALLAVILVAAFVAVYIIYANNKVYSGYTVTSEVEWTDNSGIEILPYHGNLLTYSKDGAVCTSTKGKTLWNQSFEMQNPVVALRGDYTAIGDYNGTMIYVMDSSGTQGTIDTRMPIRALDVSEKGTVIAVLDDNPITWIYLYNKDGSVLLWAQTSMSSFGYPLNVAISDDSLMMAVSYLYTDSGVLTSRVAFYNLQEVGDNYQDNLVSGFSYSDAIVPMVRFMNEEDSFAVADNRLMLYSGKQIPSSTKEIILSEEVRNVYYSENYIGLVYLNTDGSSKYKMDTYDTSGAMVQQYKFDREYSDIVFGNGLVYIYNESGCDIYNMKGTLKFSGDFEMNVECLIPGSTKEKLTLVSRNKIQNLTLK